MIVNGIASFRLCKLTDDELIEKVGAILHKMYETGEVPTRHIPALPDDDFDLLVDELRIRFYDIKNKQQ